jgi:hypothetical protein
MLTTDYTSLHELLDAEGFRHRRGVELLLELLLVIHLMDGHAVDEEKTLNPAVRDPVPDPAFHAIDRHYRFCRLDLDPHLSVHSSVSWKL